jgi:hypothetical protein
MIQVGSVSGATVYWFMITGIGVLLSGGALLELRRRGKPVRLGHLIAAGLTVLGFAALAYTGAWRSFYVLQRTTAGLQLTYHWPSRQVTVPWDSIDRINTAPGYKGQRPLRIVARSGREYVSPMLPATEAHRLSRCLSGDVARRRGSPASAAAGPRTPDACP